MPEISYRVLKHDAYPNGNWYKVACDCIEDDHALTIEFFRDKKLPEMIFIHFYKKLCWSAYWGSKGGWGSFWNRLKGSLRLFFVGHIEVEETFILNGAEHINSFIEALNEGKQQILNNSQ